MTPTNSPTQQPAGQTAPGRSAKVWARFAGRIVLGLFSLQSIILPTLAPMRAAWAQTVPAANAPAGQRALMDAAANGVPIAHIAPPTAAGVSRNQYSQFNVGANGLILNNSAGNVQTQLGGWIAGNPQLGVVPARVIVNEVTSGNASSLRGTMEVAGARANVIVANPNGISCDGCGFLNTAGRATLATGTPQYGADGSLWGLNVTRGGLTIGAGGLNAANVEQLDLIARGLVVEGEVWAKNLNALAGANQVLYDTVQATPQAGEGAAPAFAVDIKNLGGMYAGQVFLIATDKGLGVNSTGRIAALQGGLSLSSAGDLTLKDSYAKGDLQLRSGGAMTLTGLSQTDAAASLQAGGAFSNSATVDAAAQVGIEAASFANSGAINARAGGAHALTVTSAGVAGNSQGGSLYSGGDMDITAAQWQGSGDVLQSGGKLSLQAQAVTLADSQLTSAGNASLNATAGDVATTGGGIQTQAGLSVNASGQARNTGGAWQAGQGITVQAASLDNTAGTLLAGGYLAITTPGQVNNTAGQLLGAAGVSLKAASLLNSAAGVQQARIASDQAVAIRLTGGPGAAGLDNQRSLVSAKTGLSIDTGGALLNNAGGVLVASQDLSVKAGGLDNHNLGVISSGASAQVNAAGVNNHTGQIRAAQTLALNTQALDNRSGLVVAGGDAAIRTSGAVDNTAGTMASTGGALTMDTQGQALANNSGGKLQAFGNTTVTAGATSSQSGLISGQDVSLTTGTLDNRSGQVLAAGQLGMTSQALNNDAGLIQSGGNARIDTQGQALVNTHAGATGGILSGGTLTVQAGSLQNRAGYLASNGRLDVTTPGEIDNSKDEQAPQQAGQITSGASVHIQAARVVNTGSSITAVGDLGVQTAGALNNAGGTINANGSTTLNAGSLDNSSAGLIGGNDVTAIASSIGNQGGTIRASRDATLTAATLDNSNGILSAKRDLIANGAALLNAGGTIVADHSVSLDTASSELGGTVASAGNIGLTVHGDYKNTSRLTAQGNLTVNADNITNSGTLHAGQVLTANATAANGFIANSGEISGQTTVLNAGGAITNTATGLIDGTDTTLTAQSVDNAGRIYGDWLRVKAPVVNNTGAGVIAARANLAIATEHLSNTDGALIYALNDIAIGRAMDSNGSVTGNASAVLNRAATIEAGQKLAISADSIRNLNGGYTTQVVEVGRKLVRQYQSDLGGNPMTDREFFAYGETAPCNPTGTNAYSYMRNGWNPYECGTSAIIGYSKLNPDAWGKRAYVQPVTDATVSAADYQKWGVAPPAPAADGSPAAQAAAATALAAAVSAVNSAVTAYNLDIENDYAMVGCCHYYDSKFTQVTTETRLASTNPGKLLSGAGMTLQGTTVNDASTIAAGSSLAIVGPTVQNIGVPGVRETQTVDGQVRYVGTANPGGWNAFSQAPTAESFDVPAFVYLQNTNQTTGYTAAPSSTTAEGLTAAGKASVSAATLAPPTITRVSLPAGATGASAVILTTLPSLRAPANSLFTLHPQPGASYLVETDPRFTNKKTFLGSDYMLQQLSRDPSRNLKRYGDGFFEQQQVNDQILALTGRRYLADYSDTETEYKALMNAGVAFGRAYQLTPGVVLSAEQMALLTTDVVWLTTQTVTLPDGSSQQVLVPQVYLRSVQGGDLRQSGALIAGADVYIQTTRDIVNSGQIQGGNSNILVAGNDILNAGGSLRGNTVIASAVRDLQNLGGGISGIGEDSSVSLMAGRDIVLRTTTQTSAIDYGNGRASQTGIDRVATVQGGNVSLQAGRDIVARGAQVAATGDAAQGSGILSVNAQGDIRITGVQTSQQSSVNVASGNTRGGVRQDSSTNAASTFASTGDQQIAAGGRLDINGSSLAAGGSMALSGASVNIEAAKDRASSSVSANQGDGTRSRGMQSDETLSGGTVTAGRNLTIIANGKAEGEGSITATGAQLNAGGQATLAARNDITLQNATTEHSSASESHSERSGLLSSSSRTANSSSRSTIVQGSSLGGDTVLLSSGNNINVIGSNVVSDNGTALIAKNNVSIIAAQNTYEDSNFSEQKQSGLMGTGGVGFAIGKREQSGNGASSSSTSTASTVGAINGNVTIHAGNTYTQTGSDVVAPGGDIDIHAKTVSITEARETSDSQSEQKFRQSGLTIELTNPVVSAVQTIHGVAQAAGQTRDGRMQALAAATGALAVKNATDAVAKNPAQAGGVNLNFSLGSSSSQSNSQSSSNTARGSSVAAGGNVRISATGAGAESNLLVQGSSISGADVSLSADNQVNLRAARNDYSQSSTNSSKSGAVGFSIGTNGMAVTASASRGRGNSDGVDQTYTHTSVQAGNTLHIQSGADTNIVGANASGRQVTADIGGNLNIASVQDVHTYTAKDRSTGFAVSVPIGAGTGFGVSANASNTNIDSEFRSVTQQSGIRAGDGGFDVAVAGNTDLKGAVITSTDTATAASRNSLTMGSLTTSDIQNAARYSADSMSLGGGYSFGGSSIGKDQEGNAQAGGLQTPGSKLPGLNGFSATVPVALSAGGSTSSTTRSGISGAKVIITNEAEQIARTGQDAATTVANINTDVSTDRDTTHSLAPIFNEREIRAGFAITRALVQETGTFLDNRAKEADAKTLERNAAVAKGDVQAVQRLDTELADLQQWSTNGTYRQVTTALVGALSGNVTGSTAQVLQGAAVNYLQGLGASQVAILADNLGSEPARAALQGLLACAGAVAQGANCASAATGAAASVVLNTLMGDTDGLTAEQKEARRNIVGTLVGALASQGGDVSTAVNAANIETENNALSLRGSVKLADTLRGCWGKGDACNITKLRAELTTDSDRQATRIDAACSPGGSVTQCMSLAGTANATAMNLLTVGLVYADTPEKQQLVTELIKSQVTDMDALYASLQNQSAAAGVLEMLGTAIAQTIQVAGMSGMVVRSGGKANSAIGNGTNGVVVPSGFANANEFANFGGNVRGGLKSAGYPDVEPILQGSAVTGKSFGTGAPFDVGRVSDFDVALASPSLLQRARDLGIGVRSGGTRTGPLTRRDLEALGLSKLASEISAQAGRKVSFMIYQSPEAAVQRAPSISLPGGKN